MPSNGYATSARSQGEDVPEGRASGDFIAVVSNGAMIGATSAEFVATISIP